MEDENNIQELEDFDTEDTGIEIPDDWSETEEEKFSE